MATMTYKEQYLHPNWQRKRLEVMEAAGFECENCGDSETTLNVHHKRYVKGRMVWEYERGELVCLCEPCHASEHATRKALDALLVQVAGSLPSIVALVAGYIDGLLIYADEEFDASQFIGEREAEYELGLLASILDCQMPDALLRAAEAGQSLAHLTPTQRAAIDRWRDFTAKLEKSGL